MKTIVVFAIFVLEIVSAYPFPDTLPGPSYYGTYEPQHIQISELARSPDLYQQQLYIDQQNNIRRQKYENMLRNQDLNQRLASQLLTRPSYNIQPVLNTVRDPYIPRQIQPTQYEAPITQPYYSVQSQQPVRQYQPVQSQQYQEPGTENRAEVEASQAQETRQVNYPQRYSQHNAQQLAYDPRIQQLLASTPLKKRYLVLHPNGTIEHIDKIEHIVEQHPNYILVNAGSVADKPNNGVDPNQGQNPVVPQQPVAPISPVAPTAPVAPTPPVAPTGPAVPANSVVPLPPATPLVPENPNDPANTVAQANAVPTLTPPPSQVTPAKIGPATRLPAPLPPSGPVPPPTFNGTITSPNPTVLPPTGPTTVLPPTGPNTRRPPVSAPTGQPPIILNGTNPGQAIPPTPTTEPSPPTEQPPVTATPTATAIYPPPTTPLPTTVQTTVTAEPLSTTPSPVTSPSVTTPSPVTTIPSVTATATATDTSEPEQPEVTTPDPNSEDPTTEAPPTTVAPFIKPNDPQNDLDVLQVNGAKPIVWFRTKDLDFWKKLTSGDETFDVVYFFNVPREPRVTKETTTTIHADGTVVEEIKQTIYDDEDSPPRVIKTTKITKPDGTESTT